MITAQLGEPGREPRSVLAGRYSGKAAGILVSAAPPVIADFAAR